MITNNDEQAGGRILLIDLDNCPQQMARLPSDLETYSRIIACHGSVEPKLSLSLARALATAIHQGQLEFVGMKHKGKNAADFAMAFWAGRLLAETPPDTEFVILSQDTGLDHVVELLRRENRAARRIGPQGSGPPLGSDVEQDYAEHLAGRQHRPQRRRTLLASIKSFHKGRGGVNPEKVLERLIKRGLVTLDAQDIASYPAWDGDPAGTAHVSCEDEDDPIPF